MTTIEVESGVLIGMFGRHSKVIDALGMVVLCKVASVNISDISYFKKGYTVFPSRQVAEMDVTSDNKSEESREITIKLTSGEAKWSVTDSVFALRHCTAHFPVVEDPRIASDNQGEEMHSSDPCNSEISVKFEVPPLTRTRTKIKYFESRVENLEFFAKMKHTLENGTRFTTDVSGVYNGVSNIQYCLNSEIVANWNKDAKTWIQTDHS